VSKYLITDDDAIELMDFLFELAYNECGDFDNKTSSRADYLFDKLCVKTGRDAKEYYELMAELDNKFNKKDKK